ncbi:hypothetical protein HO133_009229 [Letharia lupina]|uniref:MARVEL domain-containing protein n=1 Tax=Letharia lupina TaxID=560253 RepID=A0A8H6CMV3_9LECA|nr:uncharacterized protein HO133_009229 [Letharia lupina]KAF6226363.1 hypothetical protein HO133_009229 [Letharia lupina]
MAGPDYGALGATFKIVRLLQVISLLGCIGMAANFISEMVSQNNTPSEELVGTLSVTCIAILYCAITVILHIDNILPYLINTGMDGLMLIALSVVAIVVGKPLSYLNCQVVGTSSVAESASQLSSQVKDTFNKQGGKVVYSNWIGANKTTCYEMKAVWGLSIALCILFAFSAMCSVCLWRRSKTVPPKDMA